MSLARTEKIKCPGCGKEHDFTVWDSVNTTLDPEMKAKARSGEMFRFVCPDCGAVTNVFYQCLYHQMEDQVMIYFVPNGPVDEAVNMFRKTDDQMMAAVAAAYKKRVVTQPNDFMEKLKILDAKLDDRTIEVMKLIIGVVLQQKQPDQEVQEIRFELQESGKSFVLRLKGGKWAGLPFDEDFYARMAEDYKEIFAADENVIIDQAWAMECLQKRDGEVKSAEQK